MSAPAQLRCTLYVPTSTSTIVSRIVRPQGAIIANWQARSASAILCYYVNAGREQAANIRTYADRVFHAASRVIERYPTAARLWVSPQELMPVGQLDYRTGVIALTAGGRGHLAAWFRLPTVPDTEWIYSNDIVYAKLATLKVTRNASVDPETRRTAQQMLQKTKSQWNCVIKYQLRRGACRSVGMHIELRKTEK